MQFFGIFTSFENKCCYFPSGNKVKDSLLIEGRGITMAIDVWYEKKLIYIVHEVRVLLSSLLSGLTLDHIIWSSIEIWVNFKLDTYMFCNFFHARIYSRQGMGNWEHFFLFPQCCDEYDENESRGTEMKWIFHTT